ncbi:hypothetical protein [Paracraurococcus lichenis]|uniref:Uncharacterized protein n=1 Tax=Paracraurococcus lichenis TaxID=3064888 RepID=A0ABT9E014_9PROT|nr:hypothetical protein [Paracraurococcus sp. LOR1-02]MDO9709473.1 hypothetical protein [Paracraurococcus sp. LOR1-02]
MRLNLPMSGHQAGTFVPNLIVTLLGAAILLTVLAFLPGPVLFLAVLAVTVALAVNLAALRRHGGPEVPHLPLLQEH